MEIEGVQGADGAQSEHAQGQAIWDELDAEDQGGAPSGEAQQGADQGGEERSKEEAEAEKGQGEEEQQSTGKTGGDEKGEQANVRPEYVAALEKQIAELTNLVKSTVGRVGSLQSELTKIGQVAAAAPTKTDIAQAKKDPEKWTKLKTEFPEWGEAVEEFVASQVKTGSNPADVLKSAQQFAEERANAAAIKAAKDIASLAEPDWQEVVESNEFDEWLRKQPADYVSAAAEASANWDAVRVVSIVRDFKKAQNPQRAAKGSSQQRLAAAAVPSGSNPSRRKVDDLDGKAYWDELDRQERLSAR